MSVKNCVGQELSPENTLTELTSILARGYLRYLKSQDSTEKTGVCQATHTNTNKNSMFTKNNLTTRPTNALVRTSVNKGRDGKNSQKTKKHQRTFK